jgi:hypothetical protein
MPRRRVVGEWKQYSIFHFPTELRYISEPGRAIELTVTDGNESATIIESPMCAAYVAHTYFVQLILLFSSLVSISLCMCITVTFTVSRHGKQTVLTLL